MKVVTRKYGLHELAWWPEVPTTERVSTVWKEICGIGYTESYVGKIILQGFKTIVFPWNATSFWEHIWLGDCPLKTTFPRLFLLFNQNGTLVCDMLSDSDKSWNLHFRRSLFVWELEPLVA